MKMPFISSTYDGSSRRSSGSSVSNGLRGLDRFSSSRKSSVYDRPSTYSAGSGTAAGSSYSSGSTSAYGSGRISRDVSSTPSNYRSLERLKNGSTSGTEENGGSYLSPSTPSR